MGLLCRESMNEDEDDEAFGVGKLCGERLGREGRGCEQHIEKKSLILFAFHIFLHQMKRKKQQL